MRGVNNRVGTLPNSVPHKHTRAQHVRSLDILVCNYSIFTLTITNFWNSKGTGDGVSWGGREAPKGPTPAISANYALGLNFTRIFLLALPDILGRPSWSTLFSLNQTHWSITLNFVSIFLKESSPIPRTLTSSVSYIIILSL
jgi:hypothetical protein